MNSSSNVLITPQCSCYALAPVSQVVVVAVATSTATATVGDNDVDFQK